MLDKMINYCLHKNKSKLDDELISKIHNQVYVQYNTLNIAVGRQRCGKTHTIIKEIIIILLICLAIILVLGILLYEYVPISKTIPNEVAYTTPSDVKEELLSSSDVDDDQIIVTYEVNQDDLNNYKKIQNYKPGKANPFSGSGEGSSSSTGTNTTNGNSNIGSSSNNNSGSTTTENTTSSGNQQSNSSTNNNTTTSGGSYFPDKGTK